jgi:hypothetical protein
MKRSKVFLEKLQSLCKEYDVSLYADWFSNVRIHENEEEDFSKDLIYSEGNHE